MGCSGGWRPSPPLRVVINTAGVLHGPDLQPEKRLSQLTQANLATSFGLNAFGPILLAQAIEWKRRLPFGCVSLLHPGTTATELSRPFQAGVAPGQLFSPARAAHHLLDVLEGLGEDQSGHFWAWDGSAIPW